MVNLLCVGAPAENRTLVSALPRQRSTIELQERNYGLLSSAALLYNFERVLTILLWHFQPAKNFIQCAATAITQASFWIDAASSGGTRLCHIDWPRYWHGCEESNPLREVLEAPSGPTRFTLHPYNWRSRQDSNLHPATFGGWGFLQLSYGSIDTSISTHCDRNVKEFWRTGWDSNPR